MTPPPVYKAIIKTLVRLSVFQISWSGSFRHIIHTSFFLLKFKIKTKSSFMFVAKPIRNSKIQTPVGINVQL